MAQLEEAAAVADEVIDSEAETNDAPASLEDFYAEDKPADEAEEPEADEASEDDQEEADDAEQDAEEEEVEEGPPIAAPASWKAEEKEAFAALPRNVQETISRRETERDRFVNQKAQEAATVEQRVMTQARTELVQIHERKAQEYQQLASMIMPQQPDERLLFTGNPHDVTTYHQQRAVFDAAQGHQQQLNQRAEAEAAEAQRIRQVEEQQTRREDAQRLHSELPEWFDPEQGPKLQQELQSIGTALGYPPELMAEANSSDILALRRAHEWKAKADKYDALNRDKMQRVREAKQLPKIAKPGAHGQGVKAAPADALKVLYPND